MMARALRLAERGAFTTKPNPMVGCVLAKSDEVVGEGWHQRAGGPHAEVLALQAAGDNARGATAYVTLEPCSQVGRTGPCADALIAAGIARVVAAMRDPNPLVDGGGFERLRAACVVEIGLMETLARELNYGFMSRIERGRPWVRIKLAISIDGRSAMASGESKWISGDAARHDVQRWRARSGAILTGAGTVLMDDPLLTVRLDDNTPEYERDFVPPLRVILDPGLATIARGRIREGDAPTLYIHAADARMPRGIDAQHAHVSVNAGLFDLEAVLTLMAERQINEVQIEAGATLAGAFLAAGLVDELLLYVAPIILGERARPMFDGLPIDTMAERLSMRIVETRRIGEDVRLLLRPRLDESKSAAQPAPPPREQTPASD